MHGGQQEEGPALGQRRAVEQRQHLDVVGHAPADGGIGGAAVALGHGGEPPEVIGQRLLDEHAAQKLAGSSGLTAPKKNQSRTRNRRRRPP